MPEYKKSNPPRRGGGRGPAEKPKDFKGTVKKMLGYVSAYKIHLIVIILFTIAGTIFNVVGPKILAQATTEVYNGLVAKLAGTGGINFSVIERVLLTLVILYGVSAVMNTIQGFIMTHVSQNMAYNMRKQISEKINRMPMAYFESKTVGEILSRITNDVDTMVQSMNQSVTQVISSIASLIGVLIMMFSINVTMTFAVLLILPISVVLVLSIVSVSQKYFIQQQRNLGDMNGHIEETISGQNIIHAFNKEEDVLDAFGEINERLYNSAWKSQFFGGFMPAIMGFVGNLGYVAVAVIGSYLAVRGIITVGDIQAFTQYVRTFMHPIQQMAQVSNMLQSMVAAAERVFEFLEETEETDDGSIEEYETEGSVGFSHVQFGYDPERIIIHDFSEKVESGKMVAIVGPTGAGKTTMVKLLMRFYDVNSGSITVDGRDLRDFKRAALRQNFGMVLQETWLFAGTIRDNIRYGRLDATDEEIIAAAKSAHAHRFIETLPGGYDFELNEDATNISQGQRQLLTIARAILANKKILILDEATSSVDTRTEARIQRGMNNLMKGRTSFVIAHRLSTIRNADVILVMKDGDIIEQGTHDELMAKDGFYAQLYNSQFEESA